MISQEMLALGRQGSIIRAIFEYGNRRKAEIGADKVFDFSLGNPSVPAPESVAEAIRSALSETDADALCYCRFYSGAVRRSLYARLYLHDRGCRRFTDHHAEGARSAR